MVGQTENGECGYGCSGCSSTGYGGDHKLVAAESVVVGAAAALVAAVVVGEVECDIAATINSAHPHYISSPMNMNTLSKLH